MSLIVHLVILSIFCIVHLLFSIWSSLSHFLCVIFLLDCPSLSLSLISGTSLSIYLSEHNVSINAPIYPSIYPSIYLSIYLSIFYTCISVFDSLISHSSLVYPPKCRRQARNPTFWLWWLCKEKQKDPMPTTSAAQAGSVWLHWLCTSFWDNLPGAWSSPSPRRAACSWCATPDKWPEPWSRQAWSSPLGFCPEPWVVQSRRGCCQWREWKDLHQARAICPKLHSGHSSLGLPRVGAQRAGRHPLLAPVWPAYLLLETDRSMVCQSHCRHTKSRAHWHWSAWAHTDCKVLRGLRKPWTQPRSSLWDAGACQPAWLCSCLVQKPPHPNQPVGACQ